MLLVMLMSVTGAWAEKEPIKIGSIWYELDEISMTAKVTHDGKLNDVSLPSNSHRYIGAVTIPVTVKYGGKTYNITGVAELAFFECEQLTSIDLSQTAIREMDGYNSFGSIFYACGSLTTVKLPSTLETIPDNCFAFCRALKNITIPRSVRNIGRGAFHACNNLFNFVIPDEVSNIGYDAFWDVPNIIYYGTASGSPWGANALNTTYYVDGPFAFSDAAKTHLVYCDKTVSNVVIPETVTDINDNLFANCSELTSATLPSKLKAIPSGLFSGCTKLKTVTIRSEIESIGATAFYKCPIQSITLSASLKTIGSEAFLESGLTSITIPNTVTSVGASFLKIAKILRLFICQRTYR